MMPYGPPVYHAHMGMPPPGYNPQILPAFQQPGPPYGPPLPQQQPPPQAVPQPPPPTPAKSPPQSKSASRAAPSPTRGTDPNFNNLSNTEALVKSFGVSAAIANELSLSGADKEDDLTSGRERTTINDVPRERANWISVSVRRNSSASSLAPLSIDTPLSNAPLVDVWLPKDRKMVEHITEVYFTRLNVHRPVFVRKDFEKVLGDLYDGQAVIHDPGYVCSVYLVLALGTLSELNHRAVKADVDNKADVVQHLGSAMAKKLMPYDWPEHDEFFELALSVKPDLRVTITSLQALIVLHWYLYTEVSTKSPFF